MKHSINFASSAIVCATIALFSTSCGLEQSEQSTPPVAESTSETNTTKPAVEVRHVEGAEAAKLLSENSEVVVLDIRTAEEFGSGHIEGAKNVDFYGDTFAEEIGKLDKETTYLVHCASGGRSGKSLEQFENLGFTSIIHLDGGFKGWAKAGNPVVK